MPVIGIPVGRLRSLLGVKMTPPELLTHLGHLGCDVEGYSELKRVRCNSCGAVFEMTETEEIPPTCDACGADLRDGHTDLPPLEVVRMELLAVRPDMFDPGGLARVLRGYLSVETGLARYEIGPPVFCVHVDPGVRRRESYRPEIACAVIENLTLDEDSLKIVMKLQESLHWALGRDRKHASIGIYDLDTIEPDLTYTVEDPDAVRFVPLGVAGTDRRDEMSLREILARHPKGVAYAHLLKAHAKYPVLKDGRGRVLSMPPIINSEETKVTSRTSRFFVDVTGLRSRIVERTLNIVVSSILESIPGARAQAVRIVADQAESERVTPDFTPQAMRLDPQHAERVLGVEISADEVVELLRRMRHDAELLATGKVAVQVAAYRNDIIHEIDLVEDVAIAYGYHRITPTLVPTFTVGGERPIEVLSQRVRALLCGLGFLEVMTLVLTETQAHDQLLGRAASANVVKIANPVSLEQTMVRTSLLPGLLATFRHNLTHPLPQLIFEVGDATFPDESSDTLARDRRRLACGIVSPRTGFEEAKALAEAILREFGRPWELRPLREAPFLEGRAAEACLTDAEGRNGPARVLWFGEVHPEVLERCGLQNPMVLLEGDLEALDLRR
jgi:phenylalanyl-tRNA synthetase beta chain